MSPLATLVVERPPLTVADLPRLAEAWVQEAGGFAAAGLALWLIAYALGLAPAATRAPLSRPVRALFALFLLGAAAAYAVVFWIGVLGGDAITRTQALTYGGSFALLAVGLPFVLGLRRMRAARIGALATLSIKEAIHSKVLWIFTSLLLLFMFVTWFVPAKPESQLKTFVQVVYWVMTMLIVFTAAVLGSFGIPNDLRQHTIYSLVSKPVERFEIVLGRWLGYTAIMTLVLLVMMTLSLVFIWMQGVHPDSAAASWKARVPLYGELEFRGRAAEAGTRVPREVWDYRRYIPGGPTATARAIWTFAELPSRLDIRRVVPCEFGFEIFRTSKAPEENKGVLASFTFESWRWHPSRMTEYNNELNRLLEEDKDPASREAIYDRLAERFGYFEFPSKEVFDYTTYVIDVPAGLFRNARLGYGELRQKMKQAGHGAPSAVTVSVKCEHSTQFLGMARHDLYLLDAEGWFAVNFYKGAVGLWFRLALVLGLAVACSTYLSGVVSLLASLFLYTAGLLEEYIRSVAEKKSEVGGPAEGLYRMLNRMEPMAPLDQTPTAQTAGAFDEGFRWFLHRFLNFIPDIDRFDLTEHVAEGFDIPESSLLLALVLLVGYLVPWAILAYYTITAREVAS